MSQQPGLIVICGATATGKSALALELAQQFNTVILTADSRQVYRGFDIGTAKPTIAEQQQVPHHLLDLCDPRETFTLGDYQAQAQTLIARYHAQGKTPLLVGGTGLYIKSITRGLQMPRVPPQPQLRQQLSDLGQGHCYALLAQVDPISTQRIHANDAVRTLRALEVYYTTGQPLSQQQGEQPPTYPILQIGLTWDRSTLHHRIAQRTQQMVKIGFVEEVVALGKCYGWELPLLQTLGYGELGRYIRGEIAFSEAITLTVQHTRQFAKRQETWFRSVDDLEWISLENGNARHCIATKIQDFLGYLD
ncbi:MAG: tRNA (adenosine(37)-N6)-dimethylallyltransferase MiaA [Prochlorothrix sp.]|nr:tRNA (adenosine(37)-N6)-dimethylallyltransferase MiaA [Prochlorothrix sp.]